MGVKPAPAKLTLLCQADCHNSETGRCDPSVNYISLFTGLDRKTVYEAIQKLELMGLISVEERPGKSSQYNLLISENPAPSRGKDKPKQPVPIRPISRSHLTQKRVSSNTVQPEFEQVGSPENGSTWAAKDGSDQEQVDPNSGQPSPNLPTTLPENGSTGPVKHEEGHKQGDPNLGYLPPDLPTTSPENGVAQKRGNPKTGQPELGSTGSPENGSGGDPNLGHEPTKNLPIEPTNYSDAVASATGVANSVDNSMQGIGVDYRDQSCEQLIFNRGAAFLGGYGIGNHAARTFMGMCKKKHGLGPTLDALVVAILSRPVDCPKAFILGALKNQPTPMRTDWQPEAHQVTELEAQQIPMALIRHSRDVFVIWFSELEISHSDWPRLFRDWVIREWERAEFKAERYRQWLAKSAGLPFDKPFQEAP
ncbi:MAG: helix-turn-helix domain-containing protein [Pseudomonadota bacterium]